ncbi:MAG TPA: HAD-IIIC family phosphatase [Kofleriaceae bacterium]|nr:HAD-IIIC family phosphatase [Kofleriaceae bacterium]
MSAAHEPFADPLVAFDGSPASYLKAARSLATTAETRKPITVAILASFTADVLSPYLVVEAARRGYALKAVVAPFGQIEQQLFDAASETYREKPQVIVIAIRLEDAARALCDDFVRSSPAQLAHEVDAYVARLRRLVTSIRERSTAHILICNQAPLARLVAGLADASIDPSQQDVVADLNRKIADVARSSSGTYVLDIHRLSCEVGLARWIDPKLVYWARVPLSTEAQIATAGLVARYVRAVDRPPAKCLVLDLDNTLWGGVLGEDGISGIQLGEDYPGNVFKAFQRQVRSYRDRGVLLAIASKNNEADVREAFASHPDLVLRLEDFAATQIHWNDKAQSLANIAAQLNIGTDALVFFDDNPVERAWVRERMPEVHVIEVPKDPIGYGAALDAAGVFDALAITDEDRGRAELYRSDEARKTLETESTSLEAFLENLRMKVTIGAFDAATLPRITQLIGKTNQYNLTTRRHTRADLEQMMARGGIGIWMRIEDRFGDNGLVGVAIAIPDGEDYELDTFLMSCRVLGRMAETTMFSSLARRARTRGARRMWGQYVATKRNAPAAGFLAKHGFAKSESRPEWWTCALDQIEALPTLFELVEQS